MGDMSSPFKDGVMGNLTVDPKVPISQPAGESMSSPFKDGNMGTGSMQSPTVPPGMAIGNLTQGPLATPMKDGVMSGKNKG